MVYRTSKETQERKDAKKKHILETAIKVFSRQGYHGTTVKHVVDEAGISVGSFYFYFKNKEELFEMLYDEMAEIFYEVLQQALNSDARGVDKGFSMGIASFLMEVQLKQGLARITLIEAVGLNPRFEKKRAEATRAFVNYAAEKFTVLLKDGKIHIPDVKTSATAFIGTIYNVIIEWLQGGKDNLTDYAYPLVVYNLQALRIAYEEENIKQYIKEALSQEYYR